MSQTIPNKPTILAVGGGKGGRSILLPLLPGAGGGRGWLPLCRSCPWGRGGGGGAAPLPLVLWLPRCLGSESGTSANQRCTHSDQLKGQQES